MEKTIILEVEYDDTFYSKEHIIGKLGSIAIVKEVSEKDSLETIFDMQAELNSIVFAKKQPLNGLQERLMLRASQLDSKPITGDEELAVWLRNMTTALKDEVRELEDELPFKWWSDDEFDMQNIRVECIDILHFLVSLFMYSGLTSQDVLSIYKQKHAKNVLRQKNGYIAKNKTEDDNKEVVK